MNPGACGDGDCESWSCGISVFAISLLSNVYEVRLDIIRSLYGRIVENDLPWYMLYRTI